MSVRKTVLNNGLEIVTDELETVETVSLGVWVKVGSRYEPKSLSGVSHFLEHMAFKGTGRRSAREIAEEIEAVGGQLNAYTSSEVTAYHATVMKEDIELGVDILGDILQHSVFEVEELERERAVILQEIAHAQDSPEDIVFELFQELAYPDHSLGRPITGSPEVVKALDRSKIFDYMKQNYGSSNIVIAAAGNIEHEKFCDLIENAFGELGKGNSLKPEKPSYAGGERCIRKDLEQVHVIIGYPGPSAVDSLRLEAGIGSMVLGGGMSSRLFQVIREKMGLAYSVYSFISSYQDTGLMGFYAATSPDQSEKLLEFMQYEIGNILKGITTEELKRAKALLRSGVVMSLESTSARAERAARDLVIYGKILPISDLIEQIDNVSIDGVMEAMNNYLSSSVILSQVGPAPHNA
ncbi:MAG: pitrilysin family protein [Rhodospirillaceae bacterium]